jgi:hypothetical protein
VRRFVVHCDLPREEILEPAAEGESALDVENVPITAKSENTEPNIRAVIMPGSRNRCPKGDTTNIFVGSA